MEIAEFEQVLSSGESSTVEFKRCGGVPEHDTYETICSFANHAGGSVYLGVADNGEVLGVPEKSALSIERNIANVTADSRSFAPTMVVETERFPYEDKTVIRIWVPPTSSVFRYKGQVWDRVADADERINGEMQIMQMYIRKQNIFTEQRVYPNLTMADLDLGLLKRVRTMTSNKNHRHPWNAMDDDALLRSARLYAKDYTSGAEGLTLAAGLLLGKDDTIADLAPAYVTDAVVRIQDLDRYDDRLTVRTNLLDAADELSSFLRKWLPDRFHLEGDFAVSPRDTIIRELVSNTLMHREFSSPIPGQITVSRNSIETRNASRPSFEGQIDLGDFTPVPKNPVIAHFFMQIGLDEELGSGVRNLVKYAKIYSGGTPVLKDGLVFSAKVPTGSLFSVGEQAADSGGTMPVHVDIKKDQQDSIDAVIERILDEVGEITVAELAREANVSERTARRRLAKRVQDGRLEAVGNTSNRRYLSPRSGSNEYA